MNKLTSIRIKQEDGTYSEEYPVSVLAENVVWIQGQSNSLVDILGQVSFSTNGSIQHQIDVLDNKKFNTSDLNTYLAGQISTDVASWLNTNVNPVGSTVTVDESLTISGSAADSKIVGDNINDIKSAISDIATITHGANILPPDYEDGFIKITGDYSSPTTAFRSKKFIPVSGSNIVKMASTGTTISSVYVACYNSTRTFLERIGVNTTPTTLPTGTAYIKACSTAINATTAATYEIGLALSAEAATYEAYKVIPVLNENTVFPESLYTHIHDESERVFDDSIKTYIDMESGNILNPADYEDGFIKADGGYSSPTAAFRSASYIPVSGSDIVYTRGTGAGASSLSNIYVACYDASKTFIERIPLTTTPTTLPTGTAYIKAAANAASAATAATMQMGIVLSNHPQKYTPYELAPVLRDNVVIEGVHRHSPLWWCAMGDSITEGTYSDGEGAHVVPDQTWAAITAKLCCYDLDNKGIGGTGWVKKGSQGNKKNAREQVDDIDFSGYDLVTLSFGVNDWKGGVEWGTMNDSPDLGGTVYSNMKYVLRKIITDNPYAKVIVITPFNCRQGKSQLATEATNYAIGYDYDGHTLQDMFDLEKEVCEYYGIQYIDMTHTSIINRLNIVSATPDAVHPSLDAHRCIAYQTANSLMYNS